VNQFENPSAYKDQVIATGLPASPGAAVGQIVFTAEDAEAAQAQGKPAILVPYAEAAEFSFSECIMASSVLCFISSVSREFPCLLGV
jgi:hypothetical protein